MTQLGIMFYSTLLLMMIYLHIWLKGYKSDLDTLMTTFLLEKAIYELNYEINNRPAWAIIPLRSIRSIMESHKYAYDKKLEPQSVGG